MSQPGGLPLDDQPVRWRQVLAVAFVVAALAFDGVDTQLVSFVAPVILREWGVEKATFALAAAAAMVGMAFGTWFGGRLGDLVGRKPVFVGSTIGFGIMTAASGLANGIVMLGVLRFLSGLGFGAAMPNGFALSTEWLPHRARSRAIAILAIAAPGGGIMGSAATLLLLPHVGWRGCFFVCGLATCLVGIAMLAWLPESASWLVQHGKQQRARRIFRLVTGNALLSVEPQPLTQAHQAPTIFTREFARLNIGGWLFYFLVAFVILALQSWMPTVLASAGLSVADAIKGSLAFNALALIGAFTNGLLVPRIGSAWMMRASCVGMVILMTMVGFVLAGGSVAADNATKYVIFALLGISGACISGASTAIQAVLAWSYPSNRRSSGLGFGMMASRIGGITAVLSSGWLLTAGGTRPTLFFASIVVASAAAVIVTFIIDKHIPSMRRDKTVG